MREEAGGRRQEAEGRGQGAWQKPVELVAAVKHNNLKTRNSVLVASQRSHTLYVNTELLLKKFYIFYTRVCISVCVCVCKFDFLYFYAASRKSNFICKMFGQYRQKTGKVGKASSEQQFQLSV